MITAEQINKNNITSKSAESNINDETDVSVKKFSRRNRGTRIKILSEDELKNDDDLYNQIFGGEQPDDEEFNVNEAEIQEDSYDSDFFNEEEESDGEENSFDEERGDRKKRMAENKKKMEKEMLKHRNQMIKRNKERKEKEKRTFGFRLKEDKGDDDKNENDNNKKVERPRLKLKASAKPISNENLNLKTINTNNNTNTNSDYNFNLTNDTNANNSHFLIKLESEKNQSNFSNETIYNSNKTYNDHNNYDNNNSKFYIDINSFNQHSINLDLNKEKIQANEEYSSIFISKDVFANNTSVNISPGEIKYLYEVSEDSNALKIILNRVLKRVEPKNISLRMKSKVNYNENHKIKLLNNSDSKAKKSELNKKHRNKSRNEVSALFFLSENLIVLKKKELVRHLLCSNDSEKDISEGGNSIDQDYNESSNKKTKKQKEKKSFLSLSKSGKKNKPKEGDYMIVDTIDISDEKNELNNSSNKNNLVNLNNFSLHQVSSKYKNLKNTNENTFLAKKREKHLRERYTEYMDSQTNKKKKISKKTLANNDNSIDDININTDQNNENCENYAIEESELKENSELNENNTLDNDNNPEGFRKPISILNANKNKNKCNNKIVKEKKPVKSVSFASEVTSNNNNNLGFKYNQYQSYHQQPLPSQKELLYEAIFTEIFNNQSLEELRRMEEINKRDLPSTIKKKFNEFVKIKQNSTGESKGKQLVLTYSYSYYFIK